MMKDMLSICRALSDANRIRILMDLETAPLCVCQLRELLELAASTVSKHLQVLARAGLVEKWSEGRWHYFAPAGGKPDPLRRQIMDWLRSNAEQDETVAEDRARLRRLLAETEVPVPARLRPKVLFVDPTHGPRSRMAEAVLLHRAGDKFQVLSAGFEAQDVSLLVRRVLRERDVDLRRRPATRVIDVVLEEPFAYVIALCDGEQQRWSVLPTMQNRLDWPVEDPAQPGQTKAQRLEALRRVRDEIDRRVGAWLRNLDRDGALPGWPGRVEPAAAKAS